VEAEARRVPVPPPCFLSFRLVELLLGFVHRLMTTPALGCAKRHIAGGMAVESSPGYEKRYRMAEGNRKRWLLTMTYQEWQTGSGLEAVSYQRGYDTNPNSVRDSN